LDEPILISPSPIGGRKERSMTKEDPVELDPAKLRLSQDFSAELGVKKLVTTVPVRRPDRQWFVRTHTDPAYSLEVALLDLRDDREVYVVDPVIVAEVTQEIRAKLLVTAINRQGVVFLWPINLPRPDGRVDSWSRSALAAAEAARTRWVRVVADMGLGAYEVFEAQAKLDEPNWPDLPFPRLLEIAFRDRVIRDTDHPVLRRLRGSE
jgi:hypothetical protein